MTFLGITGLLNVLVSGVLSFFVLREKAPTPVARSFGLFSLSVGLWSGAYTLWQCMTTFPGAFHALEWTLFFGMGPVIAFLYFVFSFEGLSRRRRLILFGSMAITSGFAVMDLAGMLFSSVGPRNATGLWGNPTKWLVVYIVFWGLACLTGFVVFLRTIRRADPSVRNRMYYVFLAFGVGHMGGISSWPMWYGIRFPPPEFNALISICLALLAYAVVRYRIMDIRIVIQNAAVYSAASLCLISLYVGLVSILTHSVEYAHAKPSVLSSAVVAMLIALLFHPLRLGLQRWIDRHFPRESLNQEMLREATGRFVHEIKRPLAKMSMPAQLALADLDRLEHEEHLRSEALQPLRERLSYIVRQSHDAAQKIEAIRELSLEADPQTAPIDLGALLRHVLAAEQERLKKADIVVKLDIATSLPAYVGNAQQLEVALGNLVRNAAEAMQTISHKRLLTCTVNAKTSGFELTIADSGVGIPSKSLRHIFDPWFSTKGGHGMGIGLYLTRKIIERHHGSIYAESQENQGSLFKIVLP